MENMVKSTGKQWAVTWDAVPKSQVPGRPMIYHWHGYTSLSATQMDAPGSSRLNCASKETNKLKELTAQTSMLQQSVGQLCKDWWFWWFVRSWAQGWLITEALKGYKYFAMKNTKMATVRTNVMPTIQWLFSCPWLVPESNAANPAPVDWVTLNNLCTSKNSHHTGLSIRAMQHDHAFHHLDRWFKPESKWLYHL